MPNVMSVIPGASLSVFHSPLAIWPTFHRLVSLSPAALHRMRSRGVTTIGALCGPPRDGATGSGLDDTCAAHAASGAFWPQANLPGCWEPEGSVPAPSRGLPLHLEFPVNPTPSGVVDAGPMLVTFGQQSQRAKQCPACPLRRETAVDATGAGLHGEVLDAGGD